MRFLVAFSTIAVVAANAGQDRPQPLSQQVEPDILNPVSDIEVIAPNKTYDVKLECVGCPSAFRDEDMTVAWRSSPRVNALRLRFHIDTAHSDQPSLMVNARNILPLEPINPYFLTAQIAANVTTDMIGDPGVDTSIPIQPQYEHTVLRTQEYGQLWIQLDITGLVLRDVDDPTLGDRAVKLDKDGQKLVQLLLRQGKETDELSIEDIQVVTRAERVQPYRMKCGRLAMVQTFYDPMEWDSYGQYGTWERVLNLVTGKVGDFWADNVQHSSFVLPLAVFLTFGVVMLRRWYQKRQQEKNLSTDDAETALLGSYYADAPPAYTDIPVIKIEEYD